MLRQIRAALFGYPTTHISYKSSNIFTVGNWGVRISLENKVECVDSFFSPAMLRHILKYTNQHSAAHYASKKVQWDPIDMVELKAFFGILY